MIERMKRARRVAHPTPVAQRGRRRTHVPCPADNNIGPAREAIEMSRNRLTITGAILTLAFCVIGLRLVDVSLLQAAVEPRVAFAPKAVSLQFSRADIVDRNGILLATSLPTAASSSGGNLPMYTAPTSAGMRWRLTAPPLRERERAYRA